MLGGGALPSLTQTLYKEEDIFVFTTHFYYFFMIYLFSESRYISTLNGTVGICLFSAFYWQHIWTHFQKSRILETKLLSTDADSSTNTTVGWTKNSQKPNFFEKRKKSSKTQKLKNV